MTLPELIPTEGTTRATIAELIERLTEAEQSSIGRTLRESIQNSNITYNATYNPYDPYVDPLRERTRSVPDSTYTRPSRVFSREDFAAVPSRPLRRRPEPEPDPNIELPASAIVNCYRLRSANYVGQLDNAFRFFRQQSAGRYSDRSLLRISRCADNVRSYDNTVPDELSVPTIVTLEVPSSYDEMTETKYGGVLGMALCWGDEGGRTMLAVQRRYRRKGVGGSIVRDLRARVVPVTFWVHQTNRTAQMFLLNIGLQPTGFNTAGAIRYSSDDQPPEDEDDAMGEY